MTTTPGWYDDGHGAPRWWDGTQWTEHSAEPDAEVSPAPTEAEIVEGVEASPTSEPAMVAAQSDAPGQPDAAAQPAHPAQQRPDDGSAPVDADPEGVYPGTPAGVAPAGGAFAAATAPRRSKRWIVWAILGTVLLGIVIAAAVLIPLALISAASSGQSEAERAAVATVGLYDDAWQEGDCDKLTAATTEKFRTDSQLSDCAAFAEQAAAFGTGIEDYTVNITDVESVGGEITVTTNETYTVIVDENGEPSEPTEGAQVYEYTLIESDGEWLIDYLYSE